MLIRVLTLFFFVLTSTAYGQESFPEPFGLNWEMGEAELQAAGFSHLTDMDGLKVFSSVSAPKAWSKGESYAAVVYQDRLVKVIASSIDFENDVYGTDGKKAYNDLKNLLTKKYGSPSSEIERIGLKLYDDSDEFYQCLEYSGCGAYITLYQVSGGTIGLQLKGKHRGKGYLTIQYESPEFSAAKAGVDAVQKEIDEEAF